MDKTPKISKETKEELYSNPGCLCAPFVYCIGIVGFIVKLLGREVKAEREDIANQTEDCYFPEDKPTPNQTIRVPRRGRV